ncbi:hypothetical protein IP92_01386 [Pseudoduganella flava]|uniref:DUF4190 domain-containing protein n=1 Tax=Pseudoduganella flava TaxID=871742 RepID=A0A562Q0G6_9BURK|nr:hypothetical protein [Pseudoduganella flava]QGZ38306.1 hypothetical protein GO485_04065 [Pseudoduganella flava]TWI50157.1 hypothetical protein IP92_01386 [Pseudoduganella flava]
MSLRDAPPPVSKNWWTIASLVLLYASLMLGLFIVDEFFAGSAARCNKIGYGCLPSATGVVGIGSIAGFGMALWARRNPAHRGWLTWVALALNGVPMLGCLVIAALIIPNW